jgi:hypothetical protein
MKPLRGFCYPFSVFGFQFSVPEERKTRFRFSA